MNTTMQTAEAIRIIRECARQDRSGETGGRATTTEATIHGWRRAAAEAGDLDVCRAIDALGVGRAAEVYDEINPQGE